MTEVADIDRIAPTRRPAGRPVGYQRWTDLLFVHWRVPAEELRPLIPAGLTVDTFDGSAWVGLVPFHMSGVRPAWFPSVPGVSTFHETNVRTYVHRGGADPGVWFFSLDASNSLAVRVARARWSLPYYRARMTLRRTGHEIRYEGRRLWPGESGAEYAVDATFGGLMPVPEPSVWGHAVPGTLEHFLAERYLLYTVRRDGTLLRGQVHHAPYPLREARAAECRESLLAALGIRRPAAPEHVLFSDGVSVEIFPLTAVV